MPPPMPPPMPPSTVTVTATTSLAPAPPPPCMKRHPAWNYLRYLRLTQPLLLPAEVGAALEALGMGAVSQEELGRVWSDPRLKPPPQVSLSVPLSLDSRMWLSQAGLLDMVQVDRAVTDAWKLLDDYPLRATVEMLILAGMPDGQVQSRLQQTGKEALSVGAITSFRWYFWSPARMSYADWATYLPTDPRLNSQQGQLLSLLGAGIYAARVADYRLGLATDHSDTRGGLEEAWNFSMATLREVSGTRTGPDKVAMLANIVRSLLRIEERLSESNNAADKIIERFSQFEVQRDDRQVTPLASLTANGSSSLGGARPGKDAREPKKLPEPGVEVPSTPAPAPAAAPSRARPALPPPPKSTQTIPKRRP